MRGRCGKIGLWGSVLGSLASWLAGCAPARPVGNTTDAPRGEQPWVSVFDGTGMGGWRIVQGSVTCAQGVMVLDGRERDATVIARGVHLRDGVVEVTARREPAENNDGPYTVALRLPVRLNWRSIYFVCRPAYLEVCRGSALRPFPPVERTVHYEPAGKPEAWRFVMNAGSIECYRFGRKILSYEDPDPCGGSIAVTASRCRIEILAVRYLRARTPAAAPER